MVRGQRRFWLKSQGMNVLASAPPAIGLVARRNQGGTLDLGALFQEMFNERVTTLKGDPETNTPRDTPLGGTVRVSSHVSLPI